VPAAGVSTGTGAEGTDKLFQKICRRAWAMIDRMSFQEQAQRCPGPAFIPCPSSSSISALPHFMKAGRSRFGDAGDPAGVVGAVAAVTLRGLFNDIYFQWVCSPPSAFPQERHSDREFAVDMRGRGQKAMEAALNAGAGAPAPHS